MFKDTQGKRNMVKDIDKISKRDMRKTQERIETDILVVVDIEEYMNMRNQLWRGSTEEVLNMGLYGVVVEDNTRWRKRGKGYWLESGLSILATYTQVENGLGLRLRYLEYL